MKKKIKLVGMVCPWLAENFASYENLFLFTVMYDAVGFGDELFSKQEIDDGEKVGEFTFGLERTGTGK